MCITFFITNQASKEVGKYYKLVIFFNRDEYFERPTAPADWQTMEDECRCADIDYHVSKAHEILNFTDYVIHTAIFSNKFLQKNNYFVLTL